MKIIITLEGGLVKQVLSEDPTLEYKVIDYDFDSEEPVVENPWSPVDEVITDLEETLENLRNVE